jgi:peroxiredoxin
MSEGSPMTANAYSIEEQARRLAAGMASQAPADLIAPFSAEQAQLDAAGIPAGVVEPGTALPDGELFDAHGAPTSLAAARAGQPAVVVFYRGAWCPYCNIALRTYQTELVPALAVRGFELIAVSPQKPDGSLTAQQTNELTYTVLSDPGNQISSSLGIVTQPTPEAVASQAKLGLDLTDANADGTRALPMPTTVVVDADGTIRWIDVYPNYTGRSEVPDILAAVEAAVCS